MRKQSTVNLDRLFFSAEQAYQLRQAETEMERLKAEIEQLRTQENGEIETPLSQLRTHLRDRTGMIAISLDQIHPNPDQPRRTFLADSIDAIAQSLHQEGQLQPVILIETEEENYLLFDGERRWRGAKQLGWASLQAVLIRKPEALHRQVLITALHREDLNLLDKAEAILNEVAQITQIATENIPRHLSAVCRRLTKQKKLGVLSEVVTASRQHQQVILQTLMINPLEQSILSVLLALQLNPASVDANLFPMLTLETDLKEAIRDQGLKGSHALLLQRLSAKNLQVTPKQAQNIRQQATTEVLAKQLSVSQTRQLVKHLQQRHQSPSSQKTPIREVFRVTQAVKQLSRTQLEQVKTPDLEQLEQLLHQKLGEIAGVLRDRSSDN